MKPEGRLRVERKARDHAPRAGGVQRLGPIQGISVHEAAGPDHWHDVPNGFSELYPKGNVVRLIG